jgi:hypothetical protein
VSISRYHPVHDDAIVADEDGTHVRYVDHVQALVDLTESLGEQHDTALTAAVAAEREKATPERTARTPVEEMDALHDQATRIIEKIRHNYGTFGKQWSMNDEPMIRLRCAMATAIDNAVRAEREKWKAFAGPDGEPRKVVRVVEVGKYPSDVVDRIIDPLGPGDVVFITESAIAAQTTTDAGVKP